MGLTKPCRELFSRQKIKRSTTTEAFTISVEIFMIYTISVRMRRCCCSLTDSDSIQDSMEPGGRELSGLPRSDLCWNTCCLCHFTLYACAATGVSSRYFLYEHSLLFARILCRNTLLTAPRLVRSACKARSQLWKASFAVFLATFSAHPTPAGHEGTAIVHSVLGCGSSAWPLLSLFLCQTTLFICQFY